jgi:hypothetical protein
MSWTERVWREFHADNLTRTFRDVLLMLHSYRAAGGVAWPSQETLAQRVDCDVRTVRDALKQGRRLDLLSWSERRYRAGWRWLRTSNLYRFISAAGPVQAGLRAVFRRPSTTGQFPRGGESLSNQEAQDERRADPVLLCDREAAQRALQQVREASEARQAAAFAARHPRLAGL